MLDIRFIREHAQAVQQNARQKGYEVNIDELLRLDSSRRELQQGVESLREKRNDIASQMKGGKPSDDVIAAGRQVKDELAGKESDLKAAESAYLDLLKKVPNMALEGVPVGASEDENVVAKKVGEPTTFDFPPKNH